jgi:hypothetical protein
MLNRRRATRRGAPATRGGLKGHHGNDEAGGTEANDKKKS